MKSVDPRELTEGLQKVHAPPTQGCIIQQKMLRITDLF